MKKKFFADNVLLVHCYVNQYFMSIFTRFLMKIHVRSYGNLGCCENLCLLLLSSQKIAENAKLLIFFSPKIE